MSNENFYQGGKKYILYIEIPRFVYLPFTAMSIFSDFTQKDIIENPKALAMYQRILSEKKDNMQDEEKKELQEWKELNKKMKSELSKEEFEKWRRKASYERRKDRIIARGLENYYKKKKEQEAFVEEIYKEVYDSKPSILNYDKYYTEKFKEDNTNKEGKYKFAWRSSKINNANRKRFPKINKPVRIYNRRGLSTSMSRIMDAENKAYQYILPHMNEISMDEFTMQRIQIISKYPYRLTRGRMKELCDATDIPTSHICNITSALFRGTYIASELYLGRYNFIIGDMLVTQTGHLLQPSLENNLPWLTPDTVEEIHKTRMEWWKNKGKIEPPIYRLDDAYLIKIRINEWEELAYVVPYTKKF